MKPTATILVCVLAAGLASAQSSSILQNTRNTMNSVSNHATAQSNEALGVHQTAAPVVAQKVIGPPVRERKKERPVPAPTHAGWL